jgi:F-type H+-transporting ATPase subunit delta
MASVANIYARAFADVVMARHLDPARTLEEAEQIARFVRENEALREVWSAPSISSEDKRALLDRIVERAAISRVVRNFVAVLIDKQRTNFLDEIVGQFRQELNERLGFAEAEITTARSLTQQERSQMEQDLARAIGKKIRARYEQSRALLGGAIARVGSTVYDGSVKGQLERIRQQLTSTGA